MGLLPNTVKQLGLLPIGKQINWSNLKKKCAGAQINLNKNKWNVQRLFYIYEIRSLRLPPRRPTDASLSFPRNGGFAIFPAPSVVQLRVPIGILIL